MEEKAQELKKAARFVVVGVANTLLDFTVFTVLAQLLSVNVYLAQVAGYCTGTLNSYILNRSWTFRARERFFSPALARFLTLNLCMLALSTLLLFLLYDLAGFPKLVAKAGATGVIMVVSFLCNRFWVFRETK